MLSSSNSDINETNSSYSIRPSLFTSIDLNELKATESSRSGQILSQIDLNSGYVKKFLWSLESNMKKIFDISLILIHLALRATALKKILSSKFYSRQHFILSNYFLNITVSI